MVFDRRHVSSTAAVAVAILALPCATGRSFTRAQDSPNAASLAGYKETAELLKRFVDEFVLITPGTGRFPKSFEMGSADGEPHERPLHEVTLNDSFCIARYEVPQNLYVTVMGSNPSVWGGPRNAVEMVTWQDTVDFCSRVTRLLHSQNLILPTEVIRLPTEAEWEYCCRAGSTTAFSFGNSATGRGDPGKQPSILDEYAWHTGNAAGNDPPVGALKPNAWGLYDMHGYLWEFVCDGWHADYTQAPADGRCQPGGTGHVVRGGSWRDDYSKLRCAARRALADGVRSDAIGFRCIRATAVSP